jgi:hypothetical protein
LTRASSNAVIPRGDYEGQELWKVVRKIEDEFIVEFPGLPDEEWHEFTFWRLPSSGEPYDSMMYEIRSGFMNVRIPNGWPVGLRELHCDLCDR